ncbi:hypothetical protein C6501_04880 [Candidatus Poribacteria bacterium]|nr:MAG: hypothetical protein C6501_04880 [Candidatus Poribacteria bacterium]
MSCVLSESRIIADDTKISKRLFHKLPVCAIPKAQSGRGRDRNGLSDEEHRPDEKQLGISRHIIRAIGEIRGMPKWHSYR